MPFSHSLRIDVNLVEDHNKTTAGGIAAIVSIQLVIYTYMYAAIREEHSIAATQDGNNEDKKET